MRGGVCDRKTVKAQPLWGFWDGELTQDVHSHINIPQFGSCSLSILYLRIHGVPLGSFILTTHTQSGSVRFQTVNHQIPYCMPGCHRALKVNYSAQKCFTLSSGMDTELLCQDPRPTRTLRPQQNPPISLNPLPSGGSGIWIDTKYWNSWGDS